MRRSIVPILALSVALAVGTAVALVPNGKVAQADHMMSWHNGPMGSMGDYEPGLPYQREALAPWHNPFLAPYPQAPAVSGPHGYGLRYGHGPMAPWGRMVSIHGGYFHVIANIDRNLNGLVESDEAAAVREQLFLDMDADRDGVLTEMEYLRMYMGPGHFPGSGGPHAEDMADLLAAGFQPLDEDGDGGVDKLEFMRGGEVLFAQSDSDSDGDGQVSVWEYRGHEH